MKRGYDLGITKFPGFAGGSAHARRMKRSLNGAPTPLLAHPSGAAPLEDSRRMSGLFVRCSLLFTRGTLKNS
jgi:hypothetical protein